MLIYLSMIESEADKSLFEQLYIRYKVPYFKIQ